jgi:hypothetical protein
VEIIDNDAGMFTLLRLHKHFLLLRALPQDCYVAVF